ncbi:pirin family protein [Bacteroidota bacterium]
MKARVTAVKPLGFQWEMYNPFLFCAHHQDQYPKGNNEFGIDPEDLTGRDIGNDFVLRNGYRMYHGKSVPGFPVHPHRGFETITITLEGLIDHADSKGTSGRYGYGDVQWMTAGEGIQHTEMFPLLHKEKDNPIELFQIWLNLPKASKFVAPHYKMLWKEEVPVIIKKLKSGAEVRIKLIAGSFEKSIAPEPTPDSWAADKRNEIGIWLIEMQEDTELILPPASDDVTRAIYFYDGTSLDIEGIKIPGKHQAILDPSESVSIKNRNGVSSFLVVQGRPINEPVVQYGPFVMNTRSEIQQAYQDYTLTGFGGWPWDSNSPVHGPELRRFAKYEDGSIEERKITEP